MNGLKFLPLCSLALLSPGTAAMPELPEKMLFEVRLEGRPVGSHCLWFRQSDDRLRVEVSMDLQVPLPLWFDYRYRYRATEWWRSGRLEALHVTIEDGSRQEQIRARRDRDALEVEAQGGHWRLQGDLVTSNHWNPSVLGRSRLLNTLTGKASDLEIEHEGSEALQFGARTLEVERYRLGGDLEDTRVWYDSEGHWRGLEFSARGGSRIRLHPLSPEAVIDASAEPWNRNPLCQDPGGRQSG